MNLGCYTFLLLLWLYILFTCALLLFTKGFLLKRVVIDNTSVCHSDNWMIHNLWNGVSASIRLQKEVESNFSCSRSVKPKFTKAVLIIIDGLRYDFLQYNETLDKTTPLPFQNKMKKLREILKIQSQNGKLYKFEADPPTTTMQRIKGMTTGSLPTFVDAGTNFDSYQITEDNILDHALQKDLNISFMGCSTWTELFPNHFHRKIPFSALNVKDLDTIDYGIMKNLVPEVQRSDWSIIIAHFLGVDHCGHRYGTHHPEMTRKLTEMDNVISDLVETIDEDTLLLVMGDHGMTMTGDHGGDSQDEVMAGLFAYSKKKLFSSITAMNESSNELPMISQIDIVPTLSLLLDLPVPFSNLGTVVSDFFDGDNAEYVPYFLTPYMDSIDHISKVDQNAMDNHTEFVGRVFKHINMAYVSFLNCKQTLTYINEYQKTSGDLPEDKIEAVKASFEYLEIKLEDTLESLMLVDWSDKDAVFERINEFEDFIQDLRHLHSSFQDILQHVKSICRSIWAKFDLVSISMGVTLMILIAITTFLSPSKSNIELNKYSSVVFIIGFILCAGGGYYLTKKSEEVEHASLMVFLLISFSYSLWLLVNGAYTNITKLGTIVLSVFKLSVPSLLCIISVVIHLSSLFANSYIIYEDAATLFFCQSIIIMNCAHKIFVMLKKHKVDDSSKGKAKSFNFLKTRLMQVLFGRNALKFYFISTVALFSLRFTRYFWFCREMQLMCNVSPYSLTLASLLSESMESYAHERLLFAFLSITILTMVTNFYLQYRGNMKGFTACVFSVKYAGVICCVMTVIHWNLQLIMSNKLAKILDIGYIQQLLLPRLVYLLFILALVSLIYNPVCIKIIFQSNIRNGSEEKTIPEIYTELRQKLSYKQTEDNNTKPPIVYGLRTLYSSSIISLLFILVIVVGMILTDGMAVPLMLLWICGFCYIRLFSQDSYNDVISYDQLLVAVTSLMFFTSAGFFGTGHQTTLPAIRFQSAYIGFKGSLPEIVPQVIVILLNTFASQVMCALSLPLLMIFKRLSLTEKKLKDDKETNEESEVRIVDHYETSRINLYRILIIYMALIMLKVAFSALSASIHRRHLMVWKIFAPRFLFEGVGHIITGFVLLMSYGYFIRIDNTLRRTLRLLDEVIKEINQL